MATKSKKKAAKKKAAKRAPKKTAATKAKAPAKPKAPAADAPAKAAKPPRERDPRLPKPGEILHREHHGKVIEIKVLEHGFEFDGRTWRSLSAIAREVTGVVWNGYLWAGLVKRVAKKGGAQ